MTKIAKEHAGIVISEIRTQGSEHFDDLDDAIQELARGMDLTRGRLYAKLEDVRYLHDKLIEELKQVSGAE